MSHVAENLEAVGGWCVSLAVAPSPYRSLQSPLLHLAPFHAAGAATSFTLPSTAATPLLTARRKVTGAEAHALLQRRPRGDEGSRAGRVTASSCVRRRGVEAY